MATSSDTQHRYDYLCTCEECCLKELSLKVAIKNDKPVEEKKTNEQNTIKA